MVTLGVDFDYLTRQASSKTLKIHPSEDHEASYRQRGWDFVYLIEMFYVKVVDNGSEQS